ncbi:serine/threonine-protein kinase [Hyalangium gracile]|uniref:serine/threonine-protein kinase n=1 Tax=Hyalangium gracile TaxID=394092 RepID=UPI001CCA228F|nr:serine/threonine-protein kinase [Hyalangium gracile]
MDASTGIPLGRYMLGEKLASGGMGEVFVAVQRGLEGFEKPLAIKLLLPHLVEESHVVKMFLDEARLCARMSHPNIVQILDLGREEERYFLAMELVRGVSLIKLVRVLVAQQRTLSAPLILHVARALLDALHYAHTLTGPDGKPLGLIHRDVTPHNILVSINGEVKLTDFGIAKVQAAVGQTRPGVVRGKMDYLAPEQLRFERLDSRVDQFAAGLTLFFLATGRSPFARSNTQESLKAIQHDPLPMLETLRPDLPRGLVEAIKRATEKDPSRRFASMLAFREALPPPSAAERPELLGALVREVCPTVVGTLDRASRTLAALNAASGGIVASPRPGTLSMSQDAGALQAGTLPGQPDSHAMTLSEPSLSPVGTVTETVLPEGTVAAPNMAELEPSRGDAAPYVPRPAEERGDGTVPMEPPPLRRPLPWGAIAGVAVGLLLVAGGLVGWKVMGARGQARPPPPEPPGAETTQTSDGGVGKEESGTKVEPAPGSQSNPPPGNPLQVEPPSPTPTPTQVEPPPPTPAPTTPASTDPAPPVKGTGPARPRKVGLLTLDAEPWGDVRISGKSVGQTPLAKLSVPAGNVDIEIRNPETGKMARKRVKVQPGKETFVKLELK